VYSVFNTLSKTIFNNCGDGDRHVGIYASPDNWRTCYIVFLLSVPVHLIIWKELVSEMT